ncbi:MAG: hypothetical protein ABDI07_10405 [Candidatus Kryptonium sp.]
MLLTNSHQKFRNPHLDFPTQKASYGRYGIHDYPAMLHYLVVREILKEFSSDKKTLYDPFCGSGVSLCEGLRFGLKVFGTDINPLALLITKVRTSKPVKIPINTILNKIKTSKTDIPQVKNLEYWFKDYVIEDLGKIRSAIKDFQGESFYELLLVTFSQTIRDVSNNRKGEFKRFRLSEEELTKFNPNVLEVFTKKLLDFCYRLRSDSIPTTSSSVNLYRSDTRQKIPFEEKIDVVITSPPYGDSRTTVAYGQFSSFSLDWLKGLNPYGDADLTLDKDSLGGKLTKDKLSLSKSLSSTLDKLYQIDKKRAEEVNAFYSDLFLACKNIANQLNNNAILCFVVGNRCVKGIQIPMDDIVKEIFELLGLKHLKTFIREIRNKRMPILNSPSNIVGKKSNTMKYEYVVLLEKTS